MASRKGRKYPKKRGNLLEFQRGTTIIMRVMKDILLIMSEFSSRLCSGLPSRQIFERRNALVPELKAGGFFSHMGKRPSLAYMEVQPPSFFFLLIFFSFSQVVRRAECWAANRR